MRVWTCQHIAGQVSFSCTAGSNSSATCPACCTCHRLLAGGAATGGAAKNWLCRWGEALPNNPRVHVLHNTLRVFGADNVMFRCCAMELQSGEQPASPRPSAPAAPPPSCHCRQAAVQRCQSARACWSRRPSLVYASAGRPRMLCLCWCTALETLVCPSTPALMACRQRAGLLGSDEVTGHNSSFGWRVYTAAQLPHTVIRSMM